MCTQSRRILWQQVRSKAKHFQHLPTIIHVRQLLAAHRSSEPAILKTLLHIISPAGCITAAPCTQFCQLATTTVGTARSCMSDRRRVDNHSDKSVDRCKPQRIPNKSSSPQNCTHPDLLVVSCMEKQTNFKIVATEACDRSADISADRFINHAYHDDCTVGSCAPLKWRSRITS